MPVQHVDTDVLKSMRRGVTENRLRELIGIIRDEVPGIRLRTTLILGYPTETKDHFNNLLDFMTDMKFDRLGVFAYSQEDGTTAYDLGDPITKREKQRRVAAAMKLQESISLEKNLSMIGQVLPVLIDRIEDGVAYGRTEFDTPEVDNEVIIQGAADGFDVASLSTGEFYQTEIVDAEAFDLFGVIQ
jgi:ribosomal protein S12 methylthiotransferase